MENDAEKDIDKKSMKDNIFSLSGIAILLEICGIIIFFFPLLILMLRIVENISYIIFILFSLVFPLVLFISGIVLSLIARKKETKLGWLSMIGLYLGILFIFVWIMVINGIYLAGF